jgi:hypothetical protein
VPPPEPPAPSGITEDQWAFILHLCPLAALFACCFPGAAIILPLIIWLLKRNESPKLDAVGKRVLNFQISYAIYMAAAGLGALIFSAVHLGILFYPVQLVIIVAWLVFTIMGAIKQNKGEVYQPPYVLDLIK